MIYRDPSLTTSGESCGNRGHRSVFGLRPLPQTPSCTNQFAVFDLLLVLLFFVFAFFSPLLDFFELLSLAFVFFLSDVLTEDFFVDFCPALPFCLSDDVFFASVDELFGALREPVDDDLVLLLFLAVPFVRQ